MSEKNSARRVSGENAQRSNDKLKVIFLGGVGEIGKNLTALEYGDDIVVIDCGMTFPGQDMPGIDLVIPDISYLIENKSRVRGIVLTHGHEDHIGSLPYALKEVNVPVFGTKLTLALAERKLQEHRNTNVKFNIINENTTLRLGCFRFEFLRVNHSITGSLAISVTTPVGVVFFTGDFKIDFTPVDGQQMDFFRFAEIGKKGVLLMLSDSTNALRGGYTMSERRVGETFRRLFDENKDNRIIISTFASNVHRIQQIIDVAEKHDRKVAFSGRTMVNVADVASRIGELRLNYETIVDIDKIDKIPGKELVIISTGSQGEPMSALTRMAMGDFNKVTISEGDTVIISASPIPGNEKMIYNVINQLCKKGANVVYSAIEEVHVSGHACQEELKLMHSLIKPKFFIPVHGEERHLLYHKELAVSMGMKETNVMIPELGEVIELDKKSMKRGNSVKAGAVLVDGYGLGDMQSAVIRDRKHLAEDGMVAVVVALDALSGEIISGPELILRGFVFPKLEGEDLAEDTKRQAALALDKIDVKDKENRSEAKRALAKEIKSFIYKRTKQSPLILPIFLE